MASAFSDSLMASGGLFHPPDISGTTKGMTMKDVDIHKEAQNRTNFLTYLAWSANYRLNS